MTQRKHKSPATRHNQSHWPEVAVVAAIGAAVSALVVQQRTREAEADYPPIGNFIQVDGVRLHYTDSGGERPAVVLLHGNGAMIQDFEISGLAEALSRQHRVIVFDRPGYGYSMRPRHTSWTPEAQAALFYKAIREMGIERPIILGHSWGALVAVAMGLHYHLHISGLVLASGYYFPTARADVALLSPPAVPLIGGLLRHTVAPLLGEVIAPSAIRKMFAPQPVSEEFWAEFPLGLALRPSQIRASSEEAAMMVPAATRFEEQYSKLALPTTIISGIADHIVDPQRQAAALHQVIPQSRLLLVPDAGHMVHHSATEDVAGAVDELFSQRKSPARRVSSREQRASGPPSEVPQGTGQTPAH